MLFSAPEFLWGLLAVAVPVAVHLFNFRRYRKVYFSNVSRLSELQSESRRHRQLRQWLVLAVRVLAVAFLVLAFARPMDLRHGRNAPMPEGTVVSVYLDNSFSMAASGAESSGLEQARQKAHEVADAYPRNTRFQLLTADMSGEQMQWLTREEYLDALGEVSLSPSAPLLSTVVRRQQEFLHHSGAPGQHGYVVSDFQRSVSDFASFVSDSTAVITMVPLAATGVNNLFVDSIRLDAPAYFAGGTVRVVAVLRNEGDRDAEKVPVKLILDNRERALAAVDVPAHGSATAELRFTIDGSGWTDGWVELSDYPVTFDDRYYFAISTGEKVRVLELDGGEPCEGINKLFVDDSLVVYNRQSAGVARFSPDYDFVVLNGVQSIPSGEVQQMAAWVAEGGCLLLVPPPGKDSEPAPEACNSLLSALSAPKFSRWVQRPVRAASVDLGAPLFRGVFSGASPDMELPTVQGHYLFAGQSARRSVIALADGGDLLSSVSYGSGTVYIASTPLDGHWCDFPSQALFVPTLYNMALYSRPLPEVFHTLGSSAPITLQSGCGSERQPLQLTSDGGFATIPELRQTGGRCLLLLHGELTEAGFYRLGAEHLAFNYSRRESVMDFFTRQEVAASLDGRTGFLMAGNPKKPLSDDIAARHGGRPLWHWCLLAALLSLAAEVLLLSLKKKK